jgi:hypothetical protein
VFFQVPSSFNWSVLKKAGEFRVLPFSYALILKYKEIRLKPSKKNYPSFAFSPSYSVITLFFPYAQFGDPKHT